MYHFLRYDKISIYNAYVLYHRYNIQTCVYINVMYIYTYNIHILYMYICNTDKSNPSAML